ncbi:hypothetical protein [Paenibacillus sp. MBLB4367]|uniref:hypothetical protein n=1 Tax=Paenibacillus sp. MBLB4367 TaxID=3384767 RepID=UPI003907FDFB
MNEAQALHDISGKLGRLEALQEANGKATHELTANVNRLVEKLDKSDDIAREADQRARSAHHRIDEVVKEQKELRSEITTGRRWAITTGIGAIGLFITAVALILKLKGGE